MGGWISIVIGVFAVFLFYISVGFSSLFWISLVNTILCFLVFGIMHNFAMEASKEKRTLLVKNMKLENRSLEDIKKVADLPINISERDLDAVPNWLSTANMIFSFTVFGLFIFSIYMVVR